MKFLGILFLIILLVLAAGAAYFWYSIEKPYGKIPAQGVFVEIPHGASRRAAERILKRNGLIRSAVAFEVFARQHPKRTLQAGEYFFDQPLPGKEVFWRLAKGDVYQQAFTIREGETLYDIAHDLENTGYMLAADFLPAAQDPTLIQDIAPGAKTLEGFLFPATYGLPRHMRAPELTALMVRKFRDTIQQIAPDGVSSQSSSASNSMLHLVTLASLVEHETPKPEERPIVAGVYSNRLRKGMLLQCDPTVIYALEQAGRYKGTLTLKDLLYDSPYNTYIHNGLPPGPIGSPGEASLRAALQPAQTDYLYFVANTQGGHFFAATLAEHNQNVAKYHRLLRGEPAESPASEANYSRANIVAHEGKR